ncbi:MAG TPA: hypothetical protein VFE59_03520 [Trebonia sp.]|nr:hypothetical protein [Trebonia sp.]
MLVGAADRPEVPDRGQRRPVTGVELLDPSGYYWRGTGRALHPSERPRGNPR